MKHLFLALALAVPAAHAQVQTTTVSPAVEVQRLAPQLLAFAGSDVNFANLVNGLALGLPVTLTTPLGAGATQVVTFTPLGTMSSLQVAQTLETARQALIARGIGAPTAQQIGVTLVGGPLATAAGNTQMAALVGSTTVLGASPVAQAATSTTPPVAQNLSNSTPVRNTSDSPFPRGISDTPQTLVPGVTTGATPAPSVPFATATPRANSPFINGATPAAGGTTAPFRVR